MTSRSAYLREKEKYEKKTAELNALLKKAAKEVADAEERRDAANHERDVALSDKARAEELLKGKLGEIGAATERLALLNAEHEKNIGGFNRQHNEMVAERTALDFRLGTLRREVEDLEFEKKDLGPAGESYKKLLKQIADAWKELENASSAYDKVKQLTEEARKKAEAILEGAKKTAEEWTKKYAALQVLENGLNFYYERLRRWYGEKGLRLPVEYEPDNLRKPRKKKS